MIFRSNIEKEYESEELVDILSDDESVVELDNDRDEKYSARNLFTTPHIILKNLINSIQF